MRRAGKLNWGVVFTGDNLALGEILDYARRAQKAGAESLWSTELGRDAFVPLAAIANVTEGMRLGTGVATFARPPMYAETAAMTLAEMTDNNFVLGLGTRAAGLERKLAWPGIPQTGDPDAGLRQLHSHHVDGRRGKPGQLCR